ncbi:chemotaxis protein CheC [Natrarchaeobaculum aegyptiacum]|uniref:Chemotaxis protein CheA n=1 Tax=Natrarchaeobaculum aegyptiacum TaxID=745377 RepID=A0A2Z2HSA6_9EURY|nr:chemotaxis protein CheC [Natrarchaeobaculum aegyptiacum]ARS90086.1 chemotaxis protein CheA [Natrarchaeobaculum aegyptiacum]
MEVDVQSLEIYNELARDGAESAAAALSKLTGIETHVEVTGVSIQSPADLRAEYGDDEYAGVSVALGEPLSGEAVLVFDDHGRETITGKLVPPGDEDRAESAIVEVGNIVANGFVSGWADYLGTKVETAPPSYLEGTGSAVLPYQTGDERPILVFRSSVDAVDEDVHFSILLVPDVDALERLLERRTSGGVSLEKLEVFTEMTERGAVRAAENVTTMTGLETDVEVNRLNFTPVTDISRQVGDDQRVGTVVEYRGTPSGYLAVLFDPASARRSVEALAPVAFEDGAGDGEPIEWDDTAQGAFEELCNVVVSGFLDGWANVLQTSIKHSPPSFVADMGSSIVSPIVADVARSGNYAFLLDSSIETPDAESVTCQLFALPRPGELESALEELLVERATETRADPGDVFHSGN